MYVLYVVYTPNLGLRIAVPVREGEKGCFGGSDEGVRGSSNMHRVDPQTKDRKWPKPCGYFDVVYGTSTGGYIWLNLQMIDHKLTEIQPVGHNARSSSARHRHVHRALHPSISPNLPEEIQRLAQYDC